MSLHTQSSVASRLFDHRLRLLILNTRFRVQRQVTVDQARLLRAAA